MKTHYYDIDLMLPQQINKEILFNEALLKIDSLCNLTVLDFIDEVPSTNPNAGEKYILSSGENSHNICYYLSSSKDWQMLQPKKGMMIFVILKNSFFIFNEQWQEVNFVEKNICLTASSIGRGFLGINGEFSIPPDKKYIYLYLNGNSVIKLSSIKLNKITVIIKQNFEHGFKLDWSGNILWNNKTTHEISATPNVTDIITFYKLPETDYFLAEIVGKNYQF